MVEQEAESGNPTAMFILGRYFRETKIKELQAQARTWLEKSLEGPLTHAYVNLFFYYFEEENRVDFDVLKKGAELSDIRCRWQFARMLGYGFYGHPIDVDEALSLMKSP